MFTVHTDQQPRSFQLKSMAVFWHSRQCCMHILTDVTDMQQAHRDKARHHFQRVMMRNVSHEYRTPLNAIITSAQLNMRRLTRLANTVSERVATQLHEVVAMTKHEHVSAKLMLSLVNSMVDMAHIQTDTFVFVLKRFTLAALHYSVRSMFKPQLDDKHIGLQLEVDTELTVEADEH